MGSVRPSTLNFQGTTSAMLFVLMMATACRKVVAPECASATMMGWVAADTSLDGMYSGPYGASSQMSVTGVHGVGSSRYLVDIISIAPSGQDQPWLRTGMLFLRQGETLSYQGEDGCLVTATVLRDGLSMDVSEECQTGRALPDSSRWIRDHSCPIDLRGLTTPASHLRPLTSPDGTKRSD